MTVIRPEVARGFSSAEASAKAVSPAIAGLKACATISGNVSHATCDRNPVASAAQNAAMYNCRALVDASVSTWIPTAAARPAMSLSGRTAVNQ